MDQTPGASTIPRHTATLHNDARPEWSEDVISWLLGSPALGHRLSVLDLGAGTGLGTRTIAALGHAVTAVDTPSQFQGTGTFCWWDTPHP